MTSEASTLADYGWATFFSTQIHADETDTTLPARVVAVHRDRLHVAAPGIDTSVAPFGDGEQAATVGDWLLLDAHTQRPLRRLDRKSVFKRRAAGTDVRVQLIAANVDTLLVVSSCNADFNVARLERYLALAREAQVTPVVVLTKADLADEPGDYTRAAAKLMPGLVVETLDARDAAGIAPLLAWCGHGQTVALVGSSGVGKSTLTNALAGEHRADTQGIREDDAKGRHTTTGRALHRLPDGGWLIDTPGMRELQLTDVRAGIDEVFDDVAALAQRCRFADCGHDTEPGCAIAAAIASGDIDAARVGRWRKLVAEEARNNESLAQRRARDRAFGHMADRVMAEKRLRRDR
ncbi:ribosome small subunit-dependent GTPase A [Tahibacter soli]|uniref:Small ribosomal subunit biogenesis GTPase RsgA n=1 Tax=Tahibacter soli TaxID=2983605 RepID=A0A9X3YNV0_9GAMM|nr:ribosome small subunit-dependent GTPase A [Tahibacter soli]MDC8015684.1 ribosome small subunit-dependent GTPase A [Tahibacter soli]